MSPVLAFAIALLATTVGLAVLLRGGRAHRIALDLPNARSLHAAPVPRVGGLVVVPVALATAFALGVREPAIVFGTLVLIVVGALDDRRGLPVLLRLCTHALAAFLLVLSPMLESKVEVLAAVALGISAVWAMNAYNFMDGSDGMAGGMAAIGFGACALAAGPADAGIGILCAALAGAAIGFLRFNFAPARVFLGDAGSVPLGFLAAAVGIHGSLAGLWPGWFVPLVFSPFLIDATFTLLVRLAQGQKVWHAHREHLYQRAVHAIGHRRAALAAYGVMSGSAGVALLLHSSGVQQATLASLWTVLGIFLAWALRRRLPAP